MSEPPPRLLVVAHGTASVTGRATVEAIVAAVAAARAASVDFCFLDVIEPRLADVLDDTPTVLVPLLLSTGYHVQSDIPALVEGFARTSVARHLGPNDLLTDALVERLGPIGDSISNAVALVGAGSSRAEAAAELAETGRLLADRIGRAVTVLTMTDDLTAAFAALPKPLSVATYLLAEGQFTSTIRAAADAHTTVAPPLGVHPALVALVWQRYDEVVVRGPVV